MASMLTGVDRKLRWADFQVFDTPPAGVPAAAVAQTIPNHTAVGGMPVMSGMPTIYKIPNTLAINVFLTTGSWRLTAVSKWSGKDQVWLIKHEQGHYDIYALMVRDFYYRIQAMVGVPFTNQAVLQAQMLAHRTATIGRVPALQVAYDNDTENSRNGTEQWNWWCAIQRASELHRTPLVAGPDGRYLRIELADALAAASLA